VGGRENEGREQLLRLRREGFRDRRSAALWMGDKAALAAPAANRLPAVQLGSGVCSGRPLGLALNCSCVLRVSVCVQAEEDEPEYAAVTFAKNANLGRCGRRASCVHRLGELRAQAPSWVLCCELSRSCFSLTISCTSCKLAAIPETR
jgi:hypothetical protein